MARLAQGKMEVEDGYTSKNEGCNVLCSKFDELPVSILFNTIAKLKFDLNGLAAKIDGTICPLHFSRVRNVFNEKLFILRKKLKRLLRQLIILYIIALVIAIHRSMKYPWMKRKPL